MNYFELFELPVQLNIDQKQLNKTYIQLQKKYHPDFYGQAGTNAQEEALEWSSLVNKAYRTLKHPGLTLQYLLEWKGVLSPGENYKLPPDFLMKVMELNELKMDGTDAADIRQKAAAIMEELDNSVTPLIENYNDTTTTAADLEQLKAYYFKKKYMDRLLEE